MPDNAVWLVCHKKEWAKCVQMCSNVPKPTAAPCHTMQFQFDAFCRNVNGAKGSKSGQKAANDRKLVQCGGVNRSAYFWDDVFCVFRM